MNWITGLTSTTDISMTRPESISLSKGHQQKKREVVAHGSGGDRTSERAPVDLRLAKTYMPGLSCLARGTVLILVMSRPWASLNVPLLMIFCTILYIDRAVRVEGIFDSNALLCTLLASHAANIFRSDPENHQLFIADGATGPNDLRAIAFQACFVVFSLTLLAGIDPFTVSQYAARGILHTGPDSETQHHVGVCRGYIVVLNGVLLMCVIQTPLERSSVVSPVQIMIRGYGFLLLSLAWTYAIGVPEMICLLSSTSRIPSLTLTSHGKGKRKHPSSATVVQSFLSCHMRFTHILLSSGYCLYIGSMVFTLVLLYKIYALATVQHHQSQEPATTTGENAAVHPEYFIEEGDRKDLCGTLTDENVTAPYASMCVFLDPKLIRETQGFLQSTTPSMYISYQSPSFHSGFGDMSIASGRIYPPPPPLTDGSNNSVTKDDLDAGISDCGGGGGGSGYTTDPEDPQPPPRNSQSANHAKLEISDSLNWQQQQQQQLSASTIPRVPSSAVSSAAQISAAGGLWSTATAGMGSSFQKNTQSRIGGVVLQQQQQQQEAVVMFTPHHPPLSSQMAIETNVYIPTPQIIQHDDGSKEAAAVDANDVAAMFRMAKMAQQSSSAAAAAVSSSGPPFI